MKAHVLLLNRALGSASMPQKVKGITNEWVGDSHFDPKFSCHSLTLTLEHYEKIARPLALASHLPLRNWEPHFVVEDDGKAQVEFYMLRSVAAMTIADGEEGWEEKIPIDCPMLQSVAELRVAYEKATKVPPVVLEFWKGYVAGRHGEAEKKDSTPIFNYARLCGVLTVGETPEENSVSAGAGFAPSLKPYEGFIDPVNTDVKAPSTTQSGNPELDPFTPIHAGMQFFTLRKIAKIEGASIEGLKGNEAIVGAILKNREKLREPEPAAV